VPREMVGGIVLAGMDGLAGGGADGLSRQG
jgi:hypothetical protein